MHVLLAQTAPSDLDALGGWAPPPALAEEVARALRQRGDRVDVVRLQGPVVPDSWSTGVQRLATRLLTDHAGADAVHAMDVVAAAAALAARRETGARVVVRAQPGPVSRGGPLRVLWPLVLRAADAVLAPTAADVRAAVALGASADRVVRCVDGALVAAAECSAAAPMVDEVRSEDYLLSLSGVPDDRRTIHEMLRCVVATGDRLVVASPSARDLEARGEMLRLARRYGVQGRVEAVGRVQGAALFDLVDRCQAVLATRTQPSCGLAPLVAMHRARPVVALAGAIADEVLVDGVTGRVVDPSVPYALAGAVEDIATGRFRRLAWGVAGRDRVTSCFAEEQVVRALATAHALAAA